ncbi:hypothetical protein GOODEAATRI_026611, partial [Goodea atripinnis]
SPSCSPLASDCSSRRSSVSSTSSMSSVAKHEVERVQHREMRYLLEWTEEEEDEGELGSESHLCHPLCQCPNCAPTQKVCQFLLKLSFFLQSEERKFFNNISGVLQIPVQQAGALSVNSCNKDGFTPLHVAALHGHSSLAALLIRHGANVNVRTSQNATPLHLASQNSHLQVGREGAGRVLYTCAEWKRIMDKL